jgi:integrase
LALNTGMRSGELLGLEWNRVDLQAGVIRLQATHTKIGKKRNVPLNQAARNAIINRLRFRAQYCPASPWVFAKTDGQRVQSVRESFASACQRAGIADFRPHDLRHTCAAWLAQQGVSLAEIRDLLDHRSVVTTERYAHLAPDNLREVVALLEQSRFGHGANTDPVSVPRGETVTN